MMTLGRKNRGGIYGAGIGVLALLIVAAITIWMFSMMMEAEYGTHEDMNAPIEQAKKIVGEVNKRNAGISDQPTSMPAMNGTRK